MKKILGILLAVALGLNLVGCALAAEEITVVTREAGSGTRSAFVELTGVEAKDENGNYIGTAAVIDKDLASERLAEDIDADALVILTAVEQVCINFGKPEQKSLATMTVEEARRYMAEGHFAPGSMLPKVEAAVKFVESKPGRKAIITSLDKAVEALEGKAGTTVC